MSNVAVESLKRTRDEIVNSIEYSGATIKQLAEAIERERALMEKRLGHLIEIDAALAKLGAH